MKTYLGRIGDLDVFCLAVENEGGGTLRGYVIQRGLEVLQIVLSEAEAWIWARSCFGST